MRVVFYVGMIYVNVLIFYQIIFFLGKKLFCLLWCLNCYGGFHISTVLVFISSLDNKPETTTAWMSIAEPGFDVKRKRFSWTESFKNEFVAIGPWKWWHVQSFFFYCSFPIRLRSNQETSITYVHILHLHKGQRWL